MKKNRVKDKRGVALIAVLALVTVLVMLLGALMGTNRSTFSLLRFTQTKNHMDRTVSSLYEYCQFKLEHDYTWGKEFSGARADYDGLQLTEVGDGGGQAAPVQTLAGIDSRNNTRFVVRICNNLTGEVALKEDVRNGARKDGVPQGFCRLRIKVESNEKLEGAEIMLRNPGYIGASLLANGHLEIDAKSFEMKTLDPIKNQARSLRDTRLTGMEDFFFSDAADEEDPVIWAGGKSRFRMGDNGTYKDRDEFMAIHAGRNFQSERFKDEARTLVDIPDVELQDVIEVKDPDGNRKPTRKIPPGTYEMLQFSPNDHTVVRVLARRESRSDQPLGDQSGPINKFWYQVDNGGDDVSPATVAANIGAPAGAGGTKLTSQQGSLGVDGVKVDLLQRRLILDDGYNYEVDGDFELRSGGDLQDLIKPSLFFADPDRLARFDNFEYSAVLSDTENEKDWTNRGSLRAEGRIRLNGDISGGACIAARGDVTIAPTRFSQEDGNPDVDFTIYSGGDVSIIPPKIYEQRDNREGDGSDVAARWIDRNTGRLIEAEYTNISQNEVTFHGLIYARGGVSFDLHDTQDQAQERSMLIEGMVVARDGDLTVEHADNFEITYNPKYVDKLIPSLFQQKQCRIEVTGWREFTPTSFSQ